MVKGNATGGKNYKKSKHASGTKAPYPELEEDQMAARIVRNLGNRNLECYCNDGRIRICRIRGSMRNRVWINIGDVVIISKRELSGTDDEKGDILMKYEMEHLHRLKGEAGINPLLFAIGTVEGKDEDGIEFDRSEEGAATGVVDDDADIDVDDI